jgi:GNAT superfamily N-acetyltransferase
MDIQIRLGSDDDMEALVSLSLLAWVPVFDSFLEIMGPAVFSILYPDWHESQRATVETLCKAREHAVLWVAEVAGEMAGFLVYELNHKDQTGEVQLLAVHPDYQNRGIGTTLNTFALAKMKDAGMRLAVVGTGGDPGHAPARRSYEKAGYRPFPQVWYYTDL